MSTPNQPAGRAFPPGGAQGDVLTKLSDENQDIAWAAPGSIGAGGSISATDGNVTMASVTGLSLPPGSLTDGTGGLAEVGFLPTTVDEQGTYVFAPATGDPNFKIVASSDSNDAFTVTDADNPTEINFGVDPYGFVTATGMTLTATAGLDATVLKVDGATNTVHDVVQFRDFTSFKFRMTHDGRILLLDLPTTDPGVLGQLYSNGTPSAGVPKALMVSGG